MIDKYRLDDLRLESGEKGELARWVIQLQRDLDYERRKVSAPTALAAMDADPVAWMVHARTGDQLTTDGDYVANAEGILGLHSTPLYAAPPAPVVNAEPVADVVAWHREGEERTCDIRWRRFDVAPGPLFAVAQPVATVPTFDEWLEIRGNKPLGWVKDAMRESYDACRAAMLQGGKS